jgi:hypothetical protein
MKTAMLSTLLGLSLAGCSLFQVTVNGKPVGGAAGTEAPADGTAPAAGDGTTVATEQGPAKLPGRDIKLAESLAEPVVLEGKHTGEQMVPVKITSKTPRKISVIVLGGYAYRGSSGSERLDNVKVSPEEPLEFDVRSSQGEDKRPWHLVVKDDEQTTFTGKTVVHGNPRAGATLKERVLDDYSVLSAGIRIAGDQSQSTPEFAAELFTTVDERFFVWVKKERPCHDATGPIAPGEPLLLDFLGGNSVNLRRANGERAMCYIDNADLDFELTTTRPAEITMPPAVPPKVSETGNIWSEEEFLPQAESVPRIATYKERKAKVSACFDKEWSKHDPDGKAGDYDVVQYDSRGNVKKVESMSDRIFRKVDKVCKVTALETEREGIREQLRKDGEAASAKSIETVAARFAHLKK